jgi:hypothetical protein
MKYLLLILIIPLFTSCAYLSSHTRTPMFFAGTTNIIGYATTDARAVTFFDANSTLTKFRNSNGGPTNAYSAGTIASGINEQSSGSNVVQLLNDIAAIVSKAP